MAGEVVPFFSTGNKDYSAVHEQKLIFHGITYKVSESICSKATKTILDDVS